ncbi:phosphopantothenoylcysteine decarboxylase [Neohortaea acidophila]|uniref:Phosphopantothenoylcysteine decarboxylase n=1 Tax=Neohortaea acidophila TaxID=245834 RepID=A0A6A6PIJ7_9PEZI|nr:phosphopantothenoylcysteine decarboxylase [Neohortaea acidophila]KAF2479839.1 phosphopantothenoylcysteine decarboxylase [Neohortaea acidophila]
MTSIPPNDSTQQPLKASDHFNDGKYHLLLAATGSVATIKIPNILTALSHHPNLSIRLLLSESAVEFLQNQSREQPSLQDLTTIPNVDGIYRDADEWRKPWVRGDSIAHIELRRWADLMLIAPLSANSLAKIALGLSDNLVTSVVRAWDTTGMIDAPRPGIRHAWGERKVIVVAPAMNTAMWNHPVTAKHLKVLGEEWGVEAGGWIDVLRPVEKELACGDTGSGAMRDWKEIVAHVESKLGLSTVNGG